MRLKRIHVSGFKSFVDPTSITVPGDLVGIVGPNGCGKSNVIDAVRWVMGESSARTLRGDQMADVIFNGSTSRKPVGKASVELVFDNSDGRLEGSYGQFAEVSIRRTLSRDGQSEYFVNKTRARRRDITDIFRGTGLGARSYSIIEQGMVSRIIEAKPEELRAFVEEAAGISRYKDRRRETETRIRHTRENLERVEDIRSELETQLRRLQRQSQAARRYQTLREEERTVLGQLLALRHRRLGEELETRQRQVAAAQNNLDASLSRLRGLESDIESTRARQGEAQEHLNGVQGEFYAVGAEIASLEQRIEHVRESRRREQEELNTVRSRLEAIGVQRAEDESRRIELQTRHGEAAGRREEIAATLASAVAGLESTRAEMEHWQSSWETFKELAARPEQQRQVQASRIDHLQHQRDDYLERRRRLEGERERLRADLDGGSLAALRAEVQRHDDEVGAAKLAVEECEREIDRRRDGLDTLHRRIAELGGELKRMESRRSSLEEIQAGALGRDDPQIRDWLERHGLGEAGQLADRVRVDGAWKRGVEAYLGDRLAAVCIDDLDGVLEGGLPDADLTLVDRRSAAGQGAGVVAGLLSHVDCGEFDLAPLLGRARTVASLAEAALLRAGLGADECLVTADGVIVGRNWLRTVRRQSATGALLSRAEEIDGLVADIAAMREDLARTSQEQERQRADLRELEGRREHLRAELAAASRVQAENHNRLGREEEGFELGRRRGAELDAEIEELEQRLQRVEEQLGTARQHLDQADAESGSLERRREELQAERADLVGRLEQAELHVNDVRETLHACDLERQRTETELRSLQSNLERLDRQRDEAEQRIGQLRQALESGSDPVDELNRELSEMLARRDRTEKRLAEARNTLAGFERSIRSLAESRQQSETDVSQAREDLERERMQAREVEFRIASLVEEAAREKHDIDAIVAELPEDAEEQAWVEKADNVAARIARIGPVNLVAIEEFDEQSERKSYLDKQHADLSDALTTLESVMRRIDRETKTRFRETFDQLNEGFRQYFPELFGGGQATLELTEDDLLSAGVTVMARPPGKRNSTIHLLSGGEKALTAVALLFSLFRLNPAPFCLLDEVDAPLDDANVERYCRTLRTLCERSQLVVITHNKITMEAADVLIGVTMAEPGVSRLVSVDLSQAVEMAAV